MSKFNLNFLFLYFGSHKNNNVIQFYNTINKIIKIFFIALFLKIISAFNHFFYQDIYFLSRVPVTGLIYLITTKSLQRSLINFNILPKKENDHERIVLNIPHHADFCVIFPQNYQTEQKFDTSVKVLGAITAKFATTVSVETTIIAASLKTN